MSPGVCVCVCRQSRRYIETAGRIELVFGMEASFVCLTSCCRDIRIYPKMIVLPSRMVSQSLNIKNFATARVLGLANSTQVDSECGKLATVVVGRTKLTVLATVDVRPTTLASLSQRASISVYSACEAARR